MDSTPPLANEKGLEGAANSDDVAIGQLRGLLLVRTLSGCLHLRVEIQGNVAPLLLYFAHDLTLGRCGEGVISFSFMFPFSFLSFSPRSLCENLFISFLFYISFSLLYFPVLFLFYFDL